MNDFSAAIRITHFFNFLFLSLLVRSGIEILGGHPKLYWNDHCSRGVSGSSASEASPPCAP